MPHFEHNELTTALSDGLDRQITAMETLRACLEDEHRALQARDPEKLLSVAERKTACLSNAGRINRVCRELEARDPAQATAVAGNAVRQRREELDTLTRLCRDLNNVNGSLIRRQKTRVEKTLRILSGGEPEQAGVYSPSGATVGRSSAHRILASI